MTGLIAPQMMGVAMFGAVFLLLMFGFPVAFTLVGTAVGFAFIGSLLGLFEFRLLSALPLRLTGLMENDLLQAVPLFLYLGVILQRTTLAADLLEGLSALFGQRAGGLGIATLIVAVLLAPTTGAVGATVLTIGLLALPSMLKARYDRRLAAGIVCAAGTLGTILPPSIVLILLGGAMQGATIEAQLARGALVIQPLTVEDIYLGAVGPVGVLLALYLTYIAWTAWRTPQRCPPLEWRDGRATPSFKRLVVTLFTPMLLIAAMLALIVSGLAYTVEAAACGAIAATLYTWLRGELNFVRLAETVRLVAKLTAMVFMLLIGASTFTLVFRGFEGDLLVARILGNVPGGTSGAVAAVMAATFVLGFFLDALEIIFLVVPIAMPPLLFLGADPVWLAVLTAINLQTAFLLPPFGFALFFLRGVAPPELRTTEIYRGVVPFIAIGLVVLTLVWLLPGIVTALPRRVDAPDATSPTVAPGDWPPIPPPPDSAPDSSDSGPP